MKPLQTILHPTDFTERSQVALDLACSLARDHGARLVFLHIVPASAVGAAGGPEARMRAEHAEGDLQSYRREMAERLAQLRPAKLAVDHLLKEGDPPAAILRAAQEVNADAIVMGTHGRNDEQRRLLGSVAEAVMREAPCPVVVIKAPQS
jgi:nucleotide-binding universal stress UspA family protein